MDRNIREERIELPNDEVYEYKAMIAENNTSF